MRSLPRMTQLFAISLFAVMAFAPAALAIQMQIEGTQDSLDGPPFINHCTLRKAIINANTDTAAYPQCQAGSGADEIVFNLPGTITFAYAGAGEDAGLTGDLDITASLTIIGHPDGTTIDAADLDRVFHVHSASPGVVVTLQDLHITNGTALGEGGGILASGVTLNLINVTISASHVNGGDGGGIASINSTLNITNSTISGNSASHHAGALLVDGGTATLTNSTITGNSSGLANLTGGIRNLGATSLRSTIVAGNAGTDIPNLDGTFVTLGYNVIGELGTTILAGTTGDQIDVNDTLLNFGPLQNNGGPTPTHALQSGSIALDKGHSSGSTTDQRGLTRPCDNAGITNATSGDGSDTGAYEDQVPCAANATPDAIDDLTTVAEDSGANAVDVLANDTDANGDALTVVSVTQSAHGSVAITGGGTGVSYKPNANYFGPDSFTYTIDDSHSANDTATVSVTVTNVNDAPVATGDAYSVNQDTPLNVVAPGVLTNDSDIDGDTIHAVLGVDVSNGTLALHADGSFDYMPDPGFAGTDTFTYTANDGTVNSNSATVTITVIDTAPPEITASVAIDSLWPPDHSLIDVGLSVSIADNVGVASSTIAVYSDEDDVAPGSGNQSPDAKDIAPGALRLRAERSGSGDGRVYLIIITATDTSGNTSHACLTVVVPKSMSAGDIASVNLQAAAAEAYCDANGTAPPGYVLVGE